jgi:hypothetical protein
MESPGARVAGNDRCKHAWATCLAYTVPLQTVKQTLTKLDQGIGKRTTQCHLLTYIHHFRLGPNLGLLHTSFSVVRWDEPEEGKCV